MSDYIAYTIWKGREQEFAIEAERRRLIEERRAGQNTKSERVGLQQVLAAFRMRRPVQR